ncbi:MAG TPA: aminotransferase class V-fold PLP-dependent enzyme [Saprospiraceae bacterium]|nr:aminotransferase class V-fold PLP-dependent enzyme [Saprospiraceae bacterium]HMQ83321.1 aminotransferase class V-fold PLP-dependent enzyme [Saprospiraceae bacterium]
MSLQDEMFQQLWQSKALFDLAQQYAYEYADSIFERPVFPSEEALQGLQYFDEKMPTQNGDALAIIKQLHQYGSPATLAQIGGRYFGFVNGSIIPTALAAKWLSAFWDQNTALEVMSPISAKLEQVVEQWLQELFDLPTGTAAGYVTGSSAAIYCGLAAARWRILQNMGWDLNEAGLNGAPKIRVITGRQAHSTVIKAISLLGLGKANIEWLEVDEQGRVRPERLPDFDESCLVILQAGNVNSGSFDPFETICRKAEAAGAWVHVDGAFGLWAGACQRFKHLTAGMNLAQSWSTDGHKTLNTPYDCGIVLCADREALTSALHLSGAYLTPGDGRDGMFYTPDASRRARIVELWATLKYLGRAGIEALVGGLHDRAVQFAQELQVQSFEVLNDVVFNQVLVAYGDEAQTAALLKAVQERRECWCGSSQWEERRVIRISVCSWATTAADVSRSVEAFVQGRASSIQF